MNMNHASFMDGGDDESYFASGTDIDTMSGGYSSAGESLVSQGDLDYLSDDQSEQVGGYNSDELDVDIIQVGGGGTGGKSEQENSESEQETSASESENEEDENEKEDGTPSAEVAVATVASSLHENDENMSSSSRVSDEVNNRRKTAQDSRSSQKSTTGALVEELNDSSQISQPNISNVNNATSKIDLTNEETVKTKLGEMITSNEKPFDMTITQVIDFVLKQITTGDPNKDTIRKFLNTKTGENFKTKQEKIRVLTKFYFFASQYVEYAGATDETQKNNIANQTINATILLGEDDKISKFELKIPQIKES